VATTSAWVSPRVNSAEPWVRGSTPTFDDDRAHRLECRGRRCGGRASRMLPRTTSASQFLERLPS
jgi:hypothetical protein